MDRGGWQDVAVGTVFGVALAAVPIAVDLIAGMALMLRDRIATGGHGVVSITGLTAFALSGFVVPADLPFLFLAPVVLLVATLAIPLPAPYRILILGWTTAVLLVLMAALPGAWTSAVFLMAVLPAAWLATALALPHGSRWRALPIALIAALLLAAWGLGIEASIRDVTARLVVLDVALPCLLAGMWLLHRRGWFATATFETPMGQARTAPEA